MSGFKRYTIAALLCGLLFTPAAGQSRKKVKVTPAGPPIRLNLPTDFQGLQSRVRLSVLPAGTVNADLQKLYAAYLTVFKDPKNETALHKVRTDMRQDLIRADKATAKSAHKWIRDYLLAEMQKLAADAKLSMTVRVNAMLVIADLNEAEYVVDGLKIVQSAKPLPQAFDVLIASFEDVQAPSGLRAVALKGLLRHAQLGVAGAAADRLRGVMMKTLADKKVPADRSPAAHEWFRRRAIETLGALKAPGTAAGGADVLTAMTAALVEENVSIQFRSEAACNIGRLDLASAGKVDHALIAHRLGTLAVNIAQTQTDKRALVHHLICVEQGLSGDDNPKGSLAAVAAGNAAQAKFIASLASEVDKFKVAVIKERDDAKLGAHRQTHGKTIQQLLQANSPQGQQPKAKTP